MVSIYTLKFNTTAINEQSQLLSFQITLVYQTYSLIGFIFSLIDEAKRARKNPALVSILTFKTNGSSYKHLPPNIVQLPQSTTPTSHTELEKNSVHFESGAIIYTRGDRGGGAWVFLVSIYFFQLWTSRSVIQSINS